MLEGEEVALLEDGAQLGEEALEGGDGRGMGIRVIIPGWWIAWLCSRTRRAARICYRGAGCGYTRG